MGVRGVPVVSTLDIETASESGLDVLEASVSSCVESKVCFDMMNGQGKIKSRAFHASSTY
jgi:hypothetical protein